MPRKFKPPHDDYLKRLTEKEALDLGIRLLIARILIAFNHSSLSLFLFIISRLVKIILVCFHSIVADLAIVVVSISIAYFLTHGLVNNHFTKCYVLLALGEASLSLSVLFMPFTPPSLN